MRPAPRSPRAIPAPPAQRPPQVLDEPEPQWTGDREPMDPFAAMAELPLGLLVAEVQARNPSLQAMTEAWRAAAERYPQEISLEDPMFGYMLSTHGLGRNMGEAGYMLELSQKVPWPGKRELRGERAAAEADAAGQEVSDTRLRLAEGARMAFFDYYLAFRETEVNTTTVGLMRDFRQIARARYEAGQAPQQDVLQADVELADLATGRAELTRDVRVAAARINTLLHRNADHPLPPPPARLDPPAEVPDSKSVQALAVSCRPDLAAQLARVRAEQAGLGLACKEYYPDLEVIARYDANMEDEDMRPQVGMNLNLPVYRAKRHAAVREASARVQQRRAEYQDRLDTAAFEVESSLARVASSARTVRLFTERTLPAAEQNVESARAAYTAGQLDFLRLIEANRQLYQQRQRFYQATAEYYRRAAELERAVGCPVPGLTGK